MSPTPSQLPGHSDVEDASVSKLRDADPLPVMQISNWPLVDFPRQTTAIVAGILVAGLIASVVSRSQILGLVIVLTLLVSVWRIMVPVRFELDVRGVQQIFWGRRTFLPWVAFSCYESDGTGLLLLRDRGALPFNSLRGIYISAGIRHAELQRLVHFYVHQSAANEQATVADTKLGDSDITPVSGDGFGD